MSRVSLVLAAVVAGWLVVGCRAEVAPQSAEPTGSGKGSVPSTSVPTLPPAVPFVGSSGEVALEVKTPAAEVVQLLSTYSADASGVEAARARLVAAGFDPRLADQSGGLFIPNTSSSGEIVYPQLGGLTVSKASVMVVVRQRLLADSVVQEVTRTIDVRLDLVDASWRPVDIASVGGEPIERPADLRAPITALLDEPAVEIPDSARWDLYAGLVDPRIVELLLELAKEHELAVTVMASGHPANVFGSERMSNHTRGRGVDIWSVDGTPVVDQRQADSLLRGLVERLVEEGVTELGSPFDLDGPGGVMFTNLVHQDHLHLAYRT